MEGHITQWGNCVRESLHDFFVWRVVEISCCRRVEKDRIVDWDVCSKHVGGVEVAAWAALLEIASLDPEMWGERQ